MLAVEVALPLVRRSEVFIYGRSQPHLQPVQACHRSFIYYRAMCTPPQGCPVLPHIELSVDVRHHTTRILLHARRTCQIEGNIAPVRCRVCRVCRVQFIVTILVAFGDRNRSVVAILSGPTTAKMLYLL